MSRTFTSPYTCPQTEERYYCRTCYHVGHADEVGDAIFCELCDSPAVVHESFHRAEIRAQVDAALARDDRRAEYRRTHAVVPRWANGFAVFEDRVQALAATYTEHALPEDHVESPLPDDCERPFFPERTPEELAQRKAALERAMQILTDTYCERPRGLLRRQAS